MELKEEEIKKAVQLIMNQLLIQNEREMIHLSMADIQRVTQLSPQQINELFKQISIPLCEKIQTFTGLELYQQSKQQKKISFGCSMIDQVFRGGLLPFGITEIFGEAGVGKTQFCIQICLQSQLPIEKGGIDGGTLYISTEGEVSKKRMLQIEKAIIEKYSLPQSFLLREKVKIEKILTLEHFSNFMEHHLEETIQKQKNEADYY